MEVLIERCPRCGVVVADYMAELRKQFENKNIADLELIRKPLRRREVIVMSLLGIILASGLLCLHYLATIRPPIPYNFSFIDIWSFYLATGGHIIGVAVLYTLVIGILVVASKNDRRYSRQEETLWKQFLIEHRQKTSTP